MSLATEEQWERAARGRDGREYPWDQDWNVACANSNQSGVDRTTAVGLYPQGESTEGVFDLAGNVSEWCLNEYHNPDNLRLSGDAPRVLRGGAWYLNPVYCRADRRSVYRPDGRNYYVGFRVCRGSPIVPPDAGAPNTGAPGR